MKTELTEVGNEGRLVGHPGRDPKVSEALEYLFSKFDHLVIVGVKVHDENSASDVIAGAGDFESLVNDDRFVGLLARTKKHYPEVRTILGTCERVKG